MDQPSFAPPTLFDLLARQWQRPGGIAGLAFNRDQSTVAFVGEDGSLALVAMADPEAPATRVRTSIDGDAHFPEIDPEEWAVSAKEDHPAGVGRHYGFTFQVLDRL